jgi:hypothetical protein
MSETRVNLLVGLLKYEPGWETLLNQIGTPWETIKSLPEISPSSYSIIIINKVPEKNEKEIIERFLSNGGSILTEFKSGKIFIKEKLRRKKISSLLPSENQFQTFDLLDIYNRCIIKGNEAVTVLKSGDSGTIAQIPFPVNEVFTRVIAKRKNFYFTSERLPNEIVRLQSLGAVRRLIFSVIEYLHHIRGFPFIHKWFFPGNASSVFTFRMDSDKGSQDEIEALYKLFDRYDIPAVWFLDVKSHESWIKYFQKFYNQEIGIHCYEHLSFKSFEKNFNNFLRAAEILKQNNIEYKGFAAPNGKWNYSINEAGEKIGFSYSSEFGFDYDNFPSYPWISERFSSILQLPVHPVCAGSMRRVQFSKNQMIDYFTRYIDKQITLSEPVCLYHHPTHHYNDVFESVFGYINRQNIIKFSYSQYSGWWKKRLSPELKFTWDSMLQNLYAEISNGDRDVWYRISTPNSKETISPLNNGEFSLSSFNLTEHKKTFKSPSGLSRIRKFDWRHISYNILDHWYSKKP